MNWFYAKDGQQAGPVDDAELDRLVGTGAIADSTLVWHSGLSNWQPYATLQRNAGAAVATLPAADLRAGPGPGQAQCSQCGRILPADEVVRLEGRDVCAECKPGFIQRLREGVPVQGSAAYAGFGVRFGAALLDFLILIPLYAVYFGVFFAYIIPRAQDPDAGASYQALNIGLSVGFQLLLSFYSAFCVSRFGGTPGKRICKLRVVRGDGSPVTFLRAWCRYLSKAFVSRLILFIGYFFIFFDDQKRALHDMICDTRVIQENK